MNLNDYLNTKSDEQTMELLFSILNADKLKNLHRRQAKPAKCDLM